MMELHRVNVRGQGSYVSMRDWLYVGPRLRGKRGGRSGNPVDAKLVATGTAALILHSRCKDEASLLTLPEVVNGNNLYSKYSYLLKEEEYAPYGS